MTYEKTKGVNWSRLKLIEKSPKHYKANPRKDSAAFAKGRAVHYAVLDPKSDRYTVYSETKTRGSKAYTEFAALRPDIEIFTQSEWDAATVIASAVRSDPVASALLESTTMYETPITWTDAETGIECKGIPDAYPLFDLKTTADFQWFLNDARKFGYDGQIAFYYDGLIANGSEPHTPCWIVVEKTEPYDVVVYEIDDATLQQGRDRYRANLRLLQTCMTNDEWPGIAGNQRMKLTPTTVTIEGIKYD